MLFELMAQEDMKILSIVLIVAMIIGLNAVGFI